MDNVKPFSRFVKIVGASAFVRNYGTMKVAIVVGRMLAYLYATAVEHEADILNVKKEAQNMVYEYLSRQFTMMSKARVDALVARMAEGGFIVEKPLTMYLKTYVSAEPLLVFLCDHPELLDELEIPGASFLGTSLPGTLTLATDSPSTRRRNSLKLRTARSRRRMSTWGNRFPYLRPFQFPK